MIIDFGGSWVIEKGAKMAFGDFRPKDIAERRPDQIQKEEERRRLEVESKEKN